LDTIKVLKALSDETRLRLLNLLYDQELCVCDIMEVLQITQTKASRHLSYMKNAGLLIDRKQAQWIHYSLVSQENNHFVENLVEGNLRKEPLYMADLERYGAWLKVKGKSCD
jgi:ArsR family transcriptional regulator, arsenate/arsenite/antimonite-responsive transcriptional repressor